MRLANGALAILYPTNYLTNYNIFFLTWTHDKPQDYHGPNSTIFQNKVRNLKTKPTIGDIIIKIFT